LNAYPDEIRLALVVLLDAGVFAAALRFARRRGTSGLVQAICDAFLLYFLVQYAAVALPGIFGMFTAWTMSLLALAAGAGLWIAADFPRSKGGIAATGRQVLNVGRALPTVSRDGGQGPPCEKRSNPEGPAESTVPRGASAAGRPARPPVRAPAALLSYGHATHWSADHLALLGCALFVTAYLAAHAFDQRPIPPVATDALVYHLPTAVQWIATHRLGIYPTWYWNPAASYSPGTGAVFMAWWMAPAGNDVFVRFVQLPPLLLIFFLVVRMCRLLGCSRAISGLIAIAAALSRPLFSEALFPKDDLYVTAFVAAALVALADKCMRDRLAPWRAGVAAGFVLASKYTVLLVCPLFLFMIDAPWRARWRWRQWCIAIGLVLAMALPWYARNIALTGNPLFPVDVNLFGLHLPGLFGVERDRQLSTAGGIWKMLAQTYHSLPPVLIVLLLAGWVGAWAAAGRSVLREPLPRAVVLGSAAVLSLFFITSPHHEVRYLFPLIVLWFAAAAIVLARAGLFAMVSVVANTLLRRGRARSDDGKERAAKPELKLLVRITPGRLETAAAALLAVVSAATTLDISHADKIAGLAGRALLMTAVGVGAVLLQIRVLHLRRGRLAILGSSALAIVVMYAYVQWHVYVETYRQSRFIAWQQGYPLQGPLWKWVDDNVPPDATLAYANTFFVYPYDGFNFTRRVDYAPVRRGLHNFLQFPRLGDRIPGDLIVRRMTAVMNAQADRATWLDNLRRMNAGWLVVIKHDSEDLDPDPPELGFALSGNEGGLFERVYEDEGGVVFRVRRW
jgi:hypothetical protein